MMKMIIIINLTKIYKAYLRGWNCHIFQGSISIPSRDFLLFYFLIKHVSCFNNTLILSWLSFSICNHNLFEKGLVLGKESQKWEKSGLPPVGPEETELLGRTQAQIQLNSRRMEVDEKATAKASTRTHTNSQFIIKREFDLVKFTKSYLLLVHHPAILPNLPILACKDPSIGQLHHWCSKVPVKQIWIPAVVHHQRSSCIIFHESLVWLQKSQLVHQVPVIHIVEPVDRVGIQGGKFVVGVILIWTIAL